MISHWGALIVLTVFVEVNDAAIQGPDEGNVEWGVMWRGALHPGVLTHFNIRIGRRQRDLCRLWGKTQ